MKTSKGEQQIINILKAAKIKFEREKQFQECRGGKYRFDFFLPEYNWALEVNGRQHYEYVSFFYKRRCDFLQAQERDRTKISYCLANQMRLYCIPFWELQNIENKDSLFQDKFIARNKFHNDETWRKYKSNLK